MEPPELEGALEPPATSLLPAAPPVFPVSEEEEGAAPPVGDEFPSED